MAQHTAVKADTHISAFEGQAAGVKKTAVLASSQTCEKAQSYSPPKSYKEFNAELFERLRVAEMSGDAEAVGDATALIVETNMSLVRRWAKGDEDAYQAGLGGLLHAVGKFQPERGFAFSTYSVFWIRQAIQRHNRRAERHSSDVSLDAVLVGDLLVGDTLAAPEDVAEAAVANVAGAGLRRAFDQIPPEFRSTLEANLQRERWSTPARHAWLWVAHPSAQERVGFGDGAIEEQFLSQARAMPARLAADWQLSWEEPHDEA